MSQPAYESHGGLWLGLIIACAAVLLIVQACAMSSHSGAYDRSQEYQPMPVRSANATAAASPTDPSATPSATPKATNVPAIDAAQPQSVQTAVFALGCFWGSDALYGSLPGVIHTRVGYCGGTTDNPTYHAISDYTESVQVDFDPSVITYDQLLTVFWTNCDPEARAWSRQYKSVAFYDGDEQKKAAQASRDRIAKDRGITVRTELLPVTKFYNAEGYHQKYNLQQNRALMREFAVYYPDLTDFANSTAAARINGYLDGFGSIEQFDREKAGYSLSPAAQQTLADIINSHPPKSCGLGN
ncbi:MAG TPA: peptide-methionine (S)-S-oxide reductase MsrA [Planctomycetota bacterium]|nr:peptide-methionine (S)-S-oxide reductase MsrA [Planctomycetota bacterium]